MKLIKMFTIISMIVFVLIFSITVIPKGNTSMLNDTAATGGISRGGGNESIWTGGRIRGSAYECIWTGASMRGSH